MFRHCLRRVCWFVVVVLVGLQVAVATGPLGRTPGSFTVSQNGSAIYSIPIWSPPGPAGVQPNLSLVYSSNQGEGYLGWGWAVGG